ncbi:PREDICTED: xenotropic and polytropic retrovirus receptor 1 homolog [Amphimedon queenslandica]|uniref:SPX domain-containing protein n=1 Tax=Amphimedon queenslandica TaxID=400682 RepID=A0AAN0JVZ2_AMPQE|nr:PREDICTED: xenotropic and polytropic retrovirus receptor 1 homolog [Amphimedon queenslandica]|eukprot:XP_019861238.1 PREDICTED: xenotropic and polytropic retrovirus receptor 1 homolog [Amphimedon queenslandica]
MHVHVIYTVPPSSSLLLVHESELSHQLQHLAEQVDTFSQAHRIKNSNRKRNSLIKAFCEFYYHLSLLQNFQKLNHTGFRKILKKHDKLASSDRGSNFSKKMSGNRIFTNQKKSTPSFEELKTL